MAAVLVLGLLAFSMVSGYPQQATSMRGHEPDSRIIGGSDTTIEKYPYTVSLWVTDPRLHLDGFECGASIASNYWIITAGHCIDLYMTVASQLFIRAGNSYRRNGTKHEVDQAILHPDFNYNSGFPSPDIGLIKLKTPLVYSDSIQPVNLPPAGTELTAGTVLTAVGWGQTKMLGNSSEVLREVSVPVWTYQECAEDYGSGVVNDTMICGGYKEGKKSPCYGDSGGPVVLNSTQYGIVTGGIGCALTNRPAVYAKVSHVRDWIKSITGV